MGLISTKELLDRYYASVEGTGYTKSRPNIDKPALYAYEQEIGRELIDMDAEDLFGLISELRQKRKGVEMSYAPSYNSYAQVVTVLRRIFDWYIDNITPIKNPTNDKKMKGHAAAVYLAKDKEPFRFSAVEGIIRNLHHDKEEYYADYIELILLLYYCGFYKAAEIVNMKADMIDHRNHIVRMPDKVIHLSDRCYSLLVKFHGIDEIPGWRGGYSVVSWHGSYFKFFVRPSFASGVDKRPLTSMCDIINRYIADEVNDVYGVKFSYSLLFHLGFYDHLCGKFGEDRANELLMPAKSPEDTTTLMNAASEYGIKVDNVTALKKRMLPYMKMK